MTKETTKVVRVAAGMGAGTALDASGNLWWWGPISPKPAKVTDGLDPEGLLDIGGTLGVYAKPGPNALVFFEIAPVFDADRILSTTLLAFRNSRIYSLSAEKQVRITNAFDLLGTTYYLGSEVTALDVSATAAAAVGSVFSDTDRQSRGVTAWGTGSPAAYKPVPDKTGKKLLGNIKAVAVGAASSYALADDGTIWQWAVPVMGILAGLPSELAGQPEGVVAMSAGGQAAMAIDGDGAVWTWGYDLAGQLGRRATDATGFNPPAKVNGLPKIAAIDMGPISALGVGTDGSLWQWGTRLGGKPQGPPTQIQLPSD